MKRHITRSAAAAFAAAMILTFSGCRELDETSGTLFEEPPETAQSSANSGQIQDNQSEPESPESSESQPVVISPGSTSETDDAPFVPPNNNDVGEVSGSILVLDGGRGIMLYGIGYDFGRNYAKTVNEYKAKLGANVNVYSMVVPTQVSFYLPEKYSGLSEEELPHIEDVNEHFIGIIPIDAYKALKGHVDEEIYYRTDHHWTQLGAYYAARAFAETALVPFDELSQYDRHEKEGYIGSFYASSNNDPEIKNNPETFVWYVPKRSVTTTFYDADMTNPTVSSYFINPDNISSPAEWNLTYMGGDSRIAHIKTGLKNGRRLMILKDSYADSFAPWLFGSFEEIWVVDMRYCDVSAAGLAKDKKITDLLFCSCTFSATADNQYRLAEIM